MNHKLFSLGENEIFQASVHNIQEEVRTLIETMQNMGTMHSRDKVSQGISNQTQLVLREDEVETENANFMIRFKKKKKKLEFSR